VSSLGHSYSGSGKKERIAFSAYLSETPKKLPYPDIHPHTTDPDDESSYLYLYAYVCAPARRRQSVVGAHN